MDKPLCVPQVYAYRKSFDFAIIQRTAQQNYICQMDGGFILQLAASVDELDTHFSSRGKWDTWRKPTQTGGEQASWSVLELNPRPSYCDSGTSATMLPMLQAL